MNQTQKTELLKEQIKRELKEIVKKEKRNIFSDTVLAELLSGKLVLDVDVVIETLYDLGPPIWRYVDEGGDVVVISESKPRWLVIDSVDRSVFASECLRKIPRYGVVVYLHKPTFALHLHVDSNDVVTDKNDIYYIVKHYDTDAARLVSILLS